MQAVKIKAVAKKKIPLLSIVFASVNWDAFRQNPILYPIRIVFAEHLPEAVIWMVIFSGVIFWTWGKTHDIGSTIAVIFLTFGLFGTSNYFIQSPEFSLLFEAIALFGFSLCIVALFIKKFGD